MLGGNTDEDKIENLKNFPELTEYIKRKAEYAVISARIESEMMDLGEEERRLFKRTFYIKGLTNS